MARQLSIIKQEAHGISFDKNSYKLFSEVKGIIKTEKLGPKTILFERINFGGDNKMSFKPTGTAEGGNVTLTNNINQKYKITVYSHTGRVRYKKNEE